ncbi:hypothetical protein M404DRAFT_1006882 [Pisolithus tinctorius Marx 270]|uniref:Uncharacterized protein n=1 Tax=Pisolithus tinctorius Marx 270 TaxID=870435 RepID=A0A0C3NKT9_PISTI|nr:hypothetical protein M404DRAFT_1006882 [Pisolithus tinctorius Marx 270]
MESTTDTPADIGVWYLCNGGVRRPLRKLALQYNLGLANTSQAILIRRGDS